MRMGVANSAPIVMLICPAVSMLKSISMAVLLAELANPRAMCEQEESRSTMPKRITSAPIPRRDGLRLGSIGSSWWGFGSICRFLVAANLFLTYYSATHRSMCLIAKLH
jgi:hypothetical protein